MRKMELHTCGVRPFHAMHPDLRHEQRPPDRQIVLVGNAQHERRAAQRWTPDPTVGTRTQRDGLRARARFTGRDPQPDPFTGQD